MSKLCPLTFSEGRAERCITVQCGFYYKPWEQCSMVAGAAMLTSLATNTRDLYNVLAKELPAIRGAINCSSPKIGAH